MNKHLIVTFFILLCAVTLPINVLAQSASKSATATPAEGVKQKQIEDLKERLATKVAELRNLQKRAIFGKVKSQTVSTMTIETPTNDIKIEITDTIKVIQLLKGTRTKLTTNDVDNGDTVSVFGEYDTTLDVLKAKVIFIDNATPLLFVAGRVTKKDDDEFTLTIETVDSAPFTIDVERNTKTFSWSKEDGTITKSGFSKITIGDTVHIVGSGVPKEEKRISADRVLDIGNIGPATTVSSITPSEEPETTPTASPKPSPKPSVKQSSPTPTETP